MKNSAPYKLTALLPFYLLSLFSLNAQLDNKKYLSISDSISYSTFLRHLEFLSSDDLLGRGIGTAGYLSAANYVAKEFENCGLLPFGDSGTFFQEVVLTKPIVQKSSFKLQLTGGITVLNADYGSEVTLVLSEKGQQISENLKMAFVGYGNIVPDKMINDYEGLDVNNKIVIAALGGPKNVEDPIFNDRQAKFNNAIAHGAAGIILYYPKADLFQNLIFKKVHDFLSKKMLFLTNTRNYHEEEKSMPRLPIFAKKGFIKDIMKSNGFHLKKTLKEMKHGGFVSKALNTELICSYDVHRDTIRSQNVVGLLTGSDSSVKEEYVVLGSHLDGLGIGKPVKGDSIYNGMLDNASGVAAILSIAEAFKRLNQKPKKSILFVCYTAEETGLLGSRFFVNSGSIRNKNIVANINVDMLARTFDTKDMAPLGYSHSNLSKAVDYAGAVLEIEIDDNKEAERRYLERSDQISFIERGIPSLFISGGLTALNESTNGNRTFDRWMKKIYHSPFDNLTQDYSDQEFLKAIQFNFLTTYYISNKMEEIKWDKNGWVYRKYVSKQ